jgi:hypothetical protein
MIENTLIDIHMFRDTHKFSDTDKFRDPTIFMPVKSSLNLYIFMLITKIRSNFRDPTIFRPLKSSENLFVILELVDIAASFGPVYRFIAHSPYLEIQMLLSDMWPTICRSKELLFEMQPGSLMQIQCYHTYNLYLVEYFNTNCSTELPSNMKGQVTLALEALKNIKTDVDNLPDRNFFHHTPGESPSVTQEILRLKASGLR